MTVILPGARSDGGALVGTNLLVMAQFPTGIDQPEIFIDWSGLIAGKPSSHRYFLRNRILWTNGKPVGAWLASDGAIKGSAHLTDLNQSAYLTLAQILHVS
ncbi:hypothetical protein [Pseudomonas sp. HS6]|uniref:hypothetical protein n=1 Tax=Pseudomonas sp. HS6 TaxID=2850559 RepID=UPI002018767D|nr:hypothetical protein [Pseudomonas sp. HS6]UQS17033.1 hypothetical protein JJN09_09300 [Pseudomonas sp. HS6]